MRCLKLTQIKKRNPGIDWDSRYYGRQYLISSDDADYQCRIPHFFILRFFINREIYPFSKKVCGVSLLCDDHTVCDYRRDCLIAIFGSYAFIGLFLEGRKDFK